MKQKNKANKEGQVLNVSSFMSKNVTKKLAEFNNRDETFKTCPLCFIFL